MGESMTTVRASLFYLLEIDNVFIWTFLFFQTFDQDVEYARPLPPSCT